MAALLIVSSKISGINCGLGLGCPLSPFFSLEEKPIWAKWGEISTKAGLGKVNWLDLMERFISQKEDYSGKICYYVLRKLPVRAGRAILLDYPFGVVFTTLLIQ